MCTKPKNKPRLVADFARIYRATGQIIYTHQYISKMHKVRRKKRYFCRDMRNGQKVELGEKNGVRKTEQGVCELTTQGSVLNLGHALYFLFALFSTRQCVGQKKGHCAGAIGVMQRSKKTCVSFRSVDSARNVVVAWYNSHAPYNKRSDMFATTCFERLNEYKMDGYKGHVMTVNRRH